MTKKEILLYLNVGKRHSIIVERKLLDEYAGYIREITILSEFKVMVEFNVHGYDEGGLIVYIKYDSLDQVIYELEKYMDLELEKWENFNKTGRYPQFEKENIDLNATHIKFEHDLVNNKISLPHGGKEYYSPDWKDLIEGKIEL